MRDEDISSTRVPSGAGFNTGVYPPVSYAPQALMVAVVKLFTTNRLTLLYAARIGGLLATAALLYAALSLLPKGRWGLLAVCLMPVMLQEGMSASVDGMAFGAVSLLTAWILHHMQHTKHLTMMHTVQLTLLCLLTVSCKMIYAPFMLAALALPAKAWGSRGKKAAVLTIAWGVTAALAMAWLLWCYSRYVADQPMTTGEAGIGTIMPQLQTMLSQPGRFLGVLFSTVLHGAGTWLHTMLGSGLSALNIRLPLPVLLLEAAGLLAVWLTDDALPKKDSRSVRTLMPVCAVLSLLVMLVALYAWWNPYQSGTIEGMQGRYLIPMLMPVLLAVRFRKDGKKPAGFQPLMLMLCLPAALASILRVFVICL